MSREHEPLTPEERELAQRLARLDAGAEPSPVLDARVLAAACAEARPTPVPIRDTPARQRRRPRFAWAAGLGVAASLVLAVGIAWQLRPQTGGDVQYSEAPAAASAPDEEPLAELRAPNAFPVSPPPPPPEPAKPQALDPAPPAPARQRRAIPQPPPPQEPQRTQTETESRRAEAPVVLDEPSPVDAPAPPPAPAPAEETAADAASAPRSDLQMPVPPAGPTAAMQETARERERRVDAKEASRDAAMQRSTESLDRIEITGSRIAGDADEDAGFDDQPYDDEPPASADSPQVRSAWLARIHELLAEGKVDAARASLAEFHRRYPEAPLPDDLRPLLE